MLPAVFVATTASVQKAHRVKVGSLHCLAGRFNKASYSCCRRPVPLERDGVWGTLVAEAELGARARAGGPRVGGGQDGTQEPPG